MKTSTTRKLSLILGFLSISSIAWAEGSLCDADPGPHNPWCLFHVDVAARENCRTNAEVTVERALFSKVEDQCLPKQVLQVGQTEFASLGNQGCWAGGDDAIAIARGQFYCQPDE